MRVYRSDCPGCNTFQVTVLMTRDEATLLADEITKAPGPWPGPLSERLTARINKVAR